MKQCGAGKGCVQAEVVNEADNAQEESSELLFELKIDFVGGGRVSP
jgi:hypothetical protein